VTGCRVGMVFEVNITMYHIDSGVGDVGRRQLGAITKRWAMRWMIFEDQLDSIAILPIFLDKGRSIYLYIIYLFCPENQNEDAHKHFEFRFYSHSIYLTRSKSEVCKVHLISSLFLTYMPRYSSTVTQILIK